MNVDILASNPAWWIYLSVAGGTTTITLAVWILFKRNENVCQLHSFHISS